MPGLSRRAQRGPDIWPGFVDALANLLLVIIFLLLIFVISQFFLVDTLAGRDTALRQLQLRVDELADLFSLERQTAEKAKADAAQVQEQLKASLAERSRLEESIAALLSRAQSAEEDRDKTKQLLADAQAASQTSQQALDDERARAAKLANDIVALQALKEELEKKVGALASRADENETALIKEKEASETARAQLALLNQQLAALRQQLAALNDALDASEKKNADQQVTIKNLGERLNTALAGRVQELARYRSEFFGRLREVLGNQAGIRVVGDRFVFQSEVLFATGSATLSDDARQQIQKVATALNDLAPRIPPDIDWILEVEGHTDRVPISTPQFASNWELSQARAMSVLRLLIEDGVPANRLSAAGFAEYKPLDQGTDEAALARNRRIELKFTQR